MLLLFLRTTLLFEAASMFDFLESRVGVVNCCDAFADAVAPNVSDSSANINTRFRFLPDDRPRLFDLLEDLILFFLLLRLSL